MEFQKLESEEQVHAIKNAKGSSIIFKHNTSCPISKMTREKFEEDAGLIPEGTAVYFLDLLSYRNVSDAVAQEFGVEHESPQMLVIKDGNCTLNQSLYTINAGAAAAALTA
ncbi:bacillithiol system redox-active protein YtxJ [Pedobacter sp. SYSU D00535]|uniref:bacillithiol system redox-active protein YtxJ n=1 Tax=Pedobacter sp. SYSU D00535 TaxID=2810308 RepID=UPI001A96DB82|nr:bacillithiol system redox-active protein YtxJ [Pedobacter sp. SYSU D00535]